MTLREIEQKIIQIINDSKLPIDGIYFVMRSIMQDISEKYFEYCYLEEQKEKNNNIKTNGE